jgi:hypothetical protein
MIGPRFLRVTASGRLGCHEGRNAIRTLEKLIRRRQ